MAIHIGTVFLLPCTLFRTIPSTSSEKKGSARHSHLLRPPRLCPGDVKGRRSDSSLSSYTIFPVLLPFQWILSLDCKIRRDVRETK